MCSDDRRCRSRRQRLKVKLHNLKVEQKVIRDEFRTIQARELINTENLRRYREASLVYKADQVEQLCQIVRLEAEVEVLRSIQTEILRRVQLSDRKVGST